MRSIREWLSRRRLPPAPPKGTRPGVRITYDGVTYDLTDDLVRLADENGKAVWLVRGPLHLRMRSDTLPIATHEPFPVDTELRMALKSEDGAVRFMTPEEIDRDG